MCRGCTLSLVVLLLVLDLSCSHKASIVHPKPVTAPIANGLARFFETTAWVEVTSNTMDERTYVQIVRCVCVGNNMYYPIMRTRYPTRSGPAGGIIAVDGYDTIVETQVPNEGPASRIQLPISGDIDKIVLFVRHGIRGKAIDQKQKWRCYEVALPLSDKICIDNMMSLPASDVRIDYSTFLSHLDDVRKSIDTMR